MKLHEIQEDLLETVHRGCELWFGFSGSVLPGSFRHRLSSSTVAPHLNMSRANRANIANLPQRLLHRSTQTPQCSNHGRHVSCESQRTFAPC